MDSPLLLQILRIVHIGAGIFWVGGVFIVGLFVMPALRDAGPNGRQLLVDIMLERKLATYLPITAVLTTVAGLVLFWRNMSLSHGAWAHSAMGTGMSVGAAAAILASIAGIGIAAPAAKQLAAVGAPRSDGSNTAPDPSEIARLQRRSALGSQFSMLFLIIATLAMATARYL